MSVRYQEPLYIGNKTLFFRIQIPLIAQSVAHPENDHGLSPVVPIQKRAQAAHCAN